MTNLKTSTELKAIAKERSLDKYGILILANIIIFAFCGAKVVILRQKTSKATSKNTFFNFRSANGYLEHCDNLKLG